MYICTYFKLWPTLEISNCWPQTTGIFVVSPLIISPEATSKAIPSGAKGRSCNGGVASFGWVVLRGSTRRREEQTAASTSGMAGTPPWVYKQVPMTWMIWEYIHFLRKTPKMVEIRWNCSFWQWNMLKSQGILPIPVGTLVPLNIRVVSQEDADSVCQSHRGNSKPLLGSLLTLAASNVCTFFYRNLVNLFQELAKPSQEPILAALLALSPRYHHFVEVS